MESKREILEDTFYAIIDKVLIILSPYEFLIETSWHISKILRR